MDFATIRNFSFALVAAGAILFGLACDDGTTGSSCRADSECDDGRFCNGVEFCSTEGACGAGDPPCTLFGESCDEATDRCVADTCASDADCDDGDTNPCTTPVCVGGLCQDEVRCEVPGSDGCPCFDGSMCTENDACVLGRCEGAPTCAPGQPCDEVTGLCVGSEMGACCTPSGMCEQLTAIECANRVGVHNVGMDCAEVTCTTGACCLPSGACVELTAAACGEDEGEYRGDDEACVDVTCGDPVPCCVDAGTRCVEAADAMACSAMDGVSQSDTACPEIPADGGVDACRDLLPGIWSMRLWDPATGTLSGSSQPYWFLPDGELVDGRPTNVQTDAGPISIYYALYTGWDATGDVVSASGCPQPSGFPDSGQFWTDFSISDGSLAMDPCTGECVLEFTETLFTTEPDGDMRTSVFVRRSTSRGDLPTDELCYLDCNDACNTAYPNRCLRTPPGPPWDPMFGEFDAWLTPMLDSRTCWSP